MAWFMLTCQPLRRSDGHVCKGEFDLGEKPALTIPQTALLLRDGFAYVFIVGNNNRVTQQK